jgi:hypothetical protein
MGLNLNWFKSYDTNEKHAKMEKKNHPKQYTDFFFYKIVQKQKWKYLRFLSQLRFRPV